MQTIFIYGPAAAGKFTIGSQLSEILGMPLFHNHLTVDLVASLFEFGSEAFCSLRKEIWQSSFRTAARAGQSFIFTFHPESTVQEGLIVELQQIIEESGGAVQYIELICADETVVQRLANADRSRHGKLQDEELYRHLRATGQLEYHSLPVADYTVNTALMSAEQATRQIVRYLEESGALPQAKH